MKRFALVLISLISFSCAECTHDEDFIIVPKKNVVTSISSLKEECVTESSYALQECAHINQRVANIITEIIDPAITIFEGEKLSKTELEARSHNLKSIKNNLSSIDKELSSIEKKLSSAQKKQVAKK